ncbi:Uncharacterised protein [Corynebacterium renale]|uniref:Uncharacterized protein n=1 Tax=Corynebacterium renale TaxID=1724 RepID=A0A2A9DKY3_9CORY|nr:hypothetical protein ATK06_0314 [Corynebacterium renale]SQI23651.1 Uncharacterised protein [Corynebacterium renale]
MATPVCLGYVRVAARDTKKTFWQLIHVKRQGEFSRTATECLFSIVAEYMRRSRVCSM